jgi:hypothetical protein
LALPNDEELGDLDDVAVTPEEEAEEEVEEQEGPLATADVDLELEE